MSILSQSGKIILVREPVCGRFGIHRLIAQLTSGALNVSWDGKSEITMITFNKKRTLCKILHIDDYGVDCTTRILNTGRFQVKFGRFTINIGIFIKNLKKFYLTQSAVTKQFNSLILKTKTLVQNLY